MVKAIFLMSDYGHDPTGKRSSYGTKQTLIDSRFRH